MCSVVILKIFAVSGDGKSWDSKLSAYGKSLEFKLSADRNCYASLASELKGRDECALYESVVEYADIGVWVHLQHVFFWITSVAKQFLIDAASCRGHSPQTRQEPRPRPLAMATSHFPWSWQLAMASGHGAMTHCLWSLAMPTCDGDHCPDLP